MRLRVYVTGWHKLGKCHGFRRNAKLKAISQASSASYCALVLLLLLLLMLMRLVWKEVYPLTAAVDDYYEQS